MNQPYLDIARSYIDGTAALPLAQEWAASRDQDPFSSGDAGSKEPIPLAAYRNNGSPRRCSDCGHVLSIVAISDRCGRCIQPQVHSGAKEWTEEARLRGQALVALDRRNYPAVTLPGGIRVSAGLLAWAPVLREMNAEEVATLLNLINGMPIRPKTPERKDTDALPW